MVKMTNCQLGTSLHRCAKHREFRLRKVDRLIVELQTLRRKLQTDGDRIERDIMQHAALSEQAAKLTQIVFEGVKQLPTRA
jgi:hypothetical protein